MLFDRRGRTVTVAALLWTILLILPNNQVNRSSRFIRSRCSNLDLLLRRGGPNNRPTDLEDGRVGRFPSCMTALPVPVVRGTYAACRGTVRMLHIGDRYGVGFSNGAGAEGLGDCPGEMVAGFC